MWNRVLENAFGNPVNQEPQVVCEPDDNNTYRLIKEYTFIQKIIIRLKKILRK